MGKMAEEGHSCLLQGPTVNKTTLFHMNQTCTMMQIEGCGKVELGATWFHGIVGNPLYEHAIQLGLMPRHEAEDSSKPTAYELQCHMFHKSQSACIHGSSSNSVNPSECLYKCQQQNSCEHAHDLLIILQFSE